MTEVSDQRLELEVAERDGFIVPIPLVSRGRPLFDSRGALASAPGAAGLRWTATAEREPWIAVNAGVGPARLLVRWAAAQSESPAVPGGVPGPFAGYRIETSASSTRGADGEWRLERRVTGNPARSRADVIEFDGQSWVRLTFEGGADARPVALERFDVHDASNGTDDVWLILGDELGARSFAAGSDGESVAELVHERYPGYYPAHIDEARPGEPPSRTLERLAELLPSHPAVKHVALAYGGSLRTAHERASLEALVGALQSRELAVVIAHPPLDASASREDGEAIERTLAALVARHCLIPGPDLRPLHARAAPIGDAEQPTLARPTLDEQRALRRRWLEALDVLYVPQ